jgi:hypothetical protein
MCPLIKSVQSRKGAILPEVWRKGRIVRGLRIHIVDIPKGSTSGILKPLTILPFRHTSGSIAPFRDWTDLISGHIMSYSNLSSPGREQYFPKYGEREGL